MSATPSRSRACSWRAGYEMTPRETEADVVLLNTCSVRDMAEQKAIGKMGMLGRLRANKPEMVFGFLGCMAQSRGRGTDARHGACRSRRRHAEISPRGRIRGRARPAQAGAAGAADGRCAVFHRRCRGGGGLAGNDPRSRARADGRPRRLSRSCRAATCTAPFASCRARAARSGRGASRRSCAEVEGLVARGVKEVTLLGQIVNLYGRHEFEKRGRQIALRAAARGRARGAGSAPAALHLAAPDRLPGGPGRGLCASCRSSCRTCICRCNRAATASSRPCTAPTPRSSILRSRKSCAPPGRTSRSPPTSSSAFPARRMTDYAATRDLVQRVGFDNAFIFRYSPRRDTPGGGDGRTGAGSGEGRAQPGSAAGGG